MTAPARPGFTLIELVVVIGVIILLAGLTLSVGVAVVERSERQATETTLRLLDTAVKEWEVETDRKLRWWNDGTPQCDPPSIRDRAEVHGDTKDVFIISEILDVITRAASVRSIIAQIDDRFVHRYEEGVYPPWIEGDEAGDMDAEFDGSLTVLDAWGAPVYAIHPGRPWKPQDELCGLFQDADGTIHTINEMDYGIAPNRQMVFVSPGPDGLFGIPAEGLSEDEEESAREDNLYSTPVEFASY